jgi:hypothetical protein
MNQFQNQFQLTAHGHTFDVDAFLATSTLRPDYTWRRGDPLLYSCGESKYETSGVVLMLGDGRAVPFLDQERIAIGYLESHRDELRALANFPGVEWFILGLQYHIEIDPGTLGFCMGPSARLMWHALDIGVRPTYYVSLERCPAWEGEDDTADDPPW